MDKRRPPRPEQRGHGPNRRPNAGRPPRPGYKPAPRPQSQSNPARQDAPAGEERLQKILAHAGIGSRRACEEVIRQGRVTIDGQVAKELGTKVDAQKSKVAVDGQTIHLERMVYYAVSKPKGYVSTNNDPAGRPRVVDLLPEIPQRVYTVGRLDEMSTGLILLTNDGELANKLAHPKFGVEKLYRVIVAGTPDREVLDKLVEGVWLAEGKVRARRVRVVGKKGQSTILEMVLAEGKNREVRRMLAKLGHKVMSLTRIAVGPITLKGLAFGEYRPLAQNEVEMLRRVASGQAVPSTRFSGRKPQQATGRGRPFGPGEPRRDRDRERDSAGPGAGGYPSRPPQRRDNRPPQGGPGPRRSFEGNQDSWSPPRRPQRSPSGRLEYDLDGGNARPSRPSGPPPSQRRQDWGRPGPGDSESRPRRPDGPRPSYRREDSGRSDYGGANVSRPVRRPDGPPPSQRRASSGGSYSGSRPPRPEGPPPSQRRASGGGGSSYSGTRPPRPEGLPPSQRRPMGAGGPGSKKPGRTTPPSDEPRVRRIIGMEGEAPRPDAPPGRPKPYLIKKRPPRSVLKLRRAREQREGQE